MESAFNEGEHVLTFNCGGLKENDAVVFKSNSTYFIKRINRIAGDQVFVSGDNKKLSSIFKPINRAQIVGKVILKY
jgi:phage repressor protein C with HTH and peptisase S24 domain